MLYRKLQLVRSDSHKTDFVEVYLIPILNKIYQTIMHTLICVRGDHKSTVVLSQYWYGDYCVDVTDSVCMLFP